MEPSDVLENDYEFGLFQERNRRFLILFLESSC